MPTLTTIDRNCSSPSSRGVCDEGSPKLAQCSTQEIPRDARDDGRGVTIGRDNEIALLNTIYNKKTAEFLAVYGRRRVGKTHLIREFFSPKGVYFELTGLKDGTLVDQLSNFSDQFSTTFYPGLSLKSPSNWKQAFTLLTQEIEKYIKKQKVTIFFDELPWLATKRSQFIQTLDYFWNTKWSILPNLKLIVCGSAASWMLDKLINAKGGLHNRLTQTILLQPFDLAQTKKFLKAQKIQLSNKQLLDVYMVLGGIPHYLKAVRKSKSAVQIINELCFQSDGLLFSEFDRLFASLFDNSELHLQIIQAIAKRRYGLSIQELSKQISKKTGGTFTKKLEELEAAGFIQKYLPYGRTKRNQYYRIIDEYTYFYLAWIKPYKEQQLPNDKTSYWHLASQTASWKSWAGYAFETICYKHIHHIRTALELDAIHCHIGTWRYIPKQNSEEGIQIDLIIERNDGIVSLCEIKYSDKPFLIDKTFGKNLINKTGVYEKTFPSTKQLSVVLISPFGLKKNLWSEELVDQAIRFEDLF